MPAFYPEYEVRKQVRGQNAFYHLPWTPIKKADRYEVSLQVPALAGIVEVLYQDDTKKYRLMTLEPAWYTSVQGRIREKIDADLEENPRRKKILEDQPLFYRYVLIDNWPDIQDIMFWLIRKYRGMAPGLVHSNRYREIHITQDGL